VPVFGAVVPDSTMDGVAYCGTHSPGHRGETEAAEIHTGCPEIIVSESNCHRLEIWAMKCMLAFWIAQEMHRITIFSNRQNP
jgi:hypothetical protein